MLEMNAVSDINYFKKAIAYYSDRGDDLKNIIIPLHGKMAERLGLKEVNLEQISFLIQGLDIKGNPLIKGAGLNRKGATDFTYSVPKDMSLAYSLADDEKKKEMNAMFERAIHKTMQYKEHNLTTSKRTNDLGVRKQSNEIMYMYFQHYEARNSNDPQIHYHLLDINMCSNEDGEISSQDQQMAFEHKKMLGAFFRNAVYEEFQSADFAFERHPELPDFLKLKGIDLADMEKASSRKHEIAEFLEKKNLERNVHNIKKAVLTTRRDKEHLEINDLFNAWDHNWKSQGVDKKKKYQSLKQQGKTNSQEIIRAEHIKTELMANVSAVKLATIKEKYINAYAGTLKNDDILKKVDEDLKNNNFIVLAKTCDVRPTEKMIELLIKVKNKIPKDIYEEINLDSSEEVRTILNKYAKIKLKDFEVRNFETLYTTPEVLKEEIYIAKKTADYTNEKHQLDEKLIVNEILKINKDLQIETKNPNACLSNEQTDMVYHCLGTDKSISIVNGAPGSGKTAAMKAVVSAYEKQGFNIVGSALSNRAKNGLGKDAKIDDVRNLSKLVSDLYHKDPNKRLVLNEKSVIVVDEAGQIDTITLGKILKASNGAKIILVGDYLQLPSVSQGNMFGYLRKHLGCAEVKQINRQRQRTLDDGTVEDGKMFYIDKKCISHNVIDLFGLGKVAEALSVYQQQNKLKTFETNEQKFLWLADRYFEIKEDPTQKAIIVATNAEMDLVNNAVREKLKLQGVLGTEQFKIKTKYIEKDGGVDFKEYEFARNDRIVFKKNDKELNIDNGNLGTITNILKNKNGDVVMTVKTDDGLVKTINTKNYEHIQHSYSFTSHISQGITINQVLLSFSSAMHRAGLFVGASRHRYNCEIGVSLEDISNYERKTGKAVLEEHKNTDFIKLIKEMDKQAQEEFKLNAIECKIETNDKEILDALDELKNKRAKRVSIKYGFNDVVEKYQKEQEAEIERMKAEVKEYELNNKKPTAEIKETKEVQIVETKTIKKTKKQENGLSL